MENLKILQIIALCIGVLYFLYIVGKLFIEYMPPIHHKIYYKLVIKLIENKIRMQGREPHLIGTLRFYKYKLKELEKQ